MLQVPLADVPAQSLNIALDGQNVSLNVYTVTGDDGITRIFLDVLLAGVAIRTCLCCFNLARLMPNCQYAGFVGDFVFVDTQGTSDPNSPGLGSRYLLEYLEASDLAP